MYVLITIEMRASFVGISNDLNKILYIHECTHNSINNSQIAVYEKTNATRKKRTYTDRNTFERNARVN